MHDKSIEYIITKTKLISHQLPQITACLCFVASEKYKLHVNSHFVMQMWFLTTSLSNSAESN